MVETAELAQKLSELGTLRVLDLRQAAFERGILQPWNHDGVYYMLPPDGMSAMELQRLFDEYRDRDALHIAYNAQSEMDIVHKPVLALDAYADRYFGKPAKGIVKITAVARAKVAELNTIIEELKKPFDPETFPGIGTVELTEYRPPQEDHQTVASLKPVSGDWKDLKRLEEKIKEHLAEINLIREVHVGRHAVKGLDPEVLLTSTEGTSVKGNAFLDDLARYLREHEPDHAAVEAAEAERWARASQEPAHEFVRRETGKMAPELTGAKLYREALEILGLTLDTMKEYEGLPRTFSGSIMMIEYSKPGFLGIARHFGRDQAKTLAKVYGGVRKIPSLSSGWQAHYQYNRGTRVLSIKAGPEEEKPPPGWTTII